MKFTIEECKVLKQLCVKNSNYELATKFQQEQYRLQKKLPKKEREKSVAGQGWKQTADITVSIPILKLSEGVVDAIFGKIGC